MVAVGSQIRGLSFSKRPKAVKETYWIPFLRAMFPGISVMMYGGKTRVSYLRS
jgi:hypothetical protein